MIRSGNASHDRRLRLADRIEWTAKVANFVPQLDHVDQRDRVQFDRRRKTARGVKPTLDELDDFASS